MINLLRGLILLSLVGASGTALAQDALPDLKGTWEVTTEGMRIIMEDQSVSPGQLESVYVIDWQDGNRVSGYELE